MVIHLTILTKRNLQQSQKTLCLPVRKKNPPKKKKRKKRSQLMEEIRRIMKLKSKNWTACRNILNLNRLYHAMFSLTFQYCQLSNVHDLYICHYFYLLSFYFCFNLLNLKIA